MAVCGLVDDPLFLEHVPPTPHMECPERLLGLGESVARVVSDDLVHIPPRVASTEELTLVHSLGYVRLIQQWDDRAGGLDGDTYVSPRTSHVAASAVGACIDATRAVCEDRVSFAICLVRPPGHHATPTAGMGFCIYNNVALAAMSALRGGLADRIAIVDFDVHHGNGTQDALWNEPGALYISLHQSPLYPGTGRREETGGPEALGLNLNIPLPPGSGDAEYLEAVSDIVVPELQDYAPSLLILSAGYDAHASDPIAGMAMTSEGYERMASLLAEASRGRIVLVLEGGYDPAALKACLVSQVAALVEYHRGARRIY